MTPINYLNSICEIAGRSEHYLFVNLEGNIYSLGEGEKGQIGNRKSVSSKVPALVRTQEGYLENASTVSAGKTTSMATTYDGKAYVWGDNTNKKLGITDENINYAEQVTQLQEKDESEVELKSIEIVEAGDNSSYVADIDGYVFSVGLNTLGQLGTEDNKNREVFTKIGKIDIVTRPEELKVAIHETKNVSIILSNSFNLKTDIAETQNSEILNTNKKEVTIQEIPNVDNSKTTNIDKFIPNYQITGNKIGRVDVIATAGNTSKNIWINVVNNETAEVPAKVVNGNGFTVSLKSDGTVWSWGTNTSGQLGLGDSESRNRPEKLEVAEEIIDVSSGTSHTLLLGRSGKVYSFGNNGQGQLGTGNNTTFKVPTNISLENIVKVVANENKSYAITSEGKVYAWGAGYGKSPVLLSMDKNVIDITKTYYLADDGKVRTIPTEKEDTEGKEINLSLNEYEPGTKPEIVEEKVVQIEEGTDHVLLLGESGKVYSYGSNVYGQLGDKTREERKGNITTVVRTEDGEKLENIVEVSAGDKYSIAVTQEGKAYTFGINGEQQLGYSNELEGVGIQESTCAIPKDVSTEVERVSAGYTHTAVYGEDGNVYTWGNGENGQLGNSDNSSYWEAQLVGKNIIQSNTNEILIEKGDTFDITSWIDYFNLFEDKQSTIEYEVLDQGIAFIDTNSGELMALSEGRTTVIAKEVGTEKIGVISVRVLEKGTKPSSMKILVEPQVVTSGQHTIMLKVDGAVWCYGIGTYGELGNGATKNSDQPVQAKIPAGTIITKISAGENHCLALDSDGNVWSWGRNDYNQLGINNVGEINANPTKITTLKNIKDIACGTYSSFAIGKAGEVYSWGLNANGEGGIGSYTSKITVNRALDITDAIDIKAGKNHTMILRSTGEVYVTGSNLYGELGTGDSTRRVKHFTKVEELKDIVSIATGDSNNIVIGKDGKVRAWGSNIYKELGTGSNSLHVDKPTLVTGLKDIKYIDGGKGYTLAIDSKNDVYEIGLNSSGELGDNSNINANSYKKLTSISDVMQLSAGNGYTMFLKEDGTVWACGDYTHGDRDIKSKTKSIVPVQVGNDETGLEKTEITIGVGEKEEIADNCAYEFNLIKLEENLADSLDFKSLKDEIATVDDDGVVTGERVGTTRVNATSTVDGKVYSVLVKVVKEKGQYAPKVEGGENFGAVLKANGEIWTFGYNADGRLALGNSITKDIPEKTNIISTYSDVKAGKDFIIALRDNGTVWSAGNNTYGQLGDGTRNSNNKLSQIQGLSDIVQIAVGDDFVIAMDDLGIVYAWGNNNSGQLGNIGANVLKPTEIAVGSQRIIDISAGNRQVAFVTAKGTVLGMGTILNTTIPNIENAIKAEVTNNSIIILTSESKVYEYKNGKVSEISISDVIDISAKSGNVMYQTVDEKTYVSGENTYGELGVNSKTAVNTPKEVNNHGEDTFGIGAGYTNTYIIENVGSVYASGNNEYGSLGNGTRTESLEHILVGERAFKAEPESATMQVGDEEDIKVTGNPFNVFNDIVMSNDEYNWTSDADNVVSVNNGHIQALSKGTAHITVEDKITKETVTLTRVVIDQDKDRILEIKVNDTEATVSPDSTENDIKYIAKVVTNDTNGKLQIRTKVGTDRIKVNQDKDIDEAEWSINGSYISQVDLTDKVTKFTITVEAQNNNGEYTGVAHTYTLIVERITDDIQLEKVTVTSTDNEGATNTIQATPVSSTVYEVVVDEPTTISLVDVIARSEYTEVSIDGLEYEKHEQDKNIVMEKHMSREVTITVRTEAGTEAEYKLIIHKKSEIMNLLNVKVNNQEAKKVSEMVYAVTVDKDCNLATIEASIESELASISIAEMEYQAKISTRQVSINKDVTEVTIRVKVDEDIKEYTLYIYRAEDDKIEPNLRLDMLIVNGTVITPESDKETYIVYLPSTETEATIRAIAEDSTTMVQIEDSQKVAGDNEKKVAIPNSENVFTVTLTNTTGDEKQYTVKIRKAEKDVSLDRIYVTKEDMQMDAVLQDDGTYLVRVPSNYENVDVTAVAGFAKAKVKVTEDGTFVVKQATENVELATESTRVTVTVQSEDGTNEQEYILIIEKKSNNTNLLTVEVDGNAVELGEDGKYHYQLKTAENSVNVRAETQDKNASVRIANGGYELHETQKQIDITAKQTEVKIVVKSEEGETQEYILVIEGLPDDTTIAEVKVNGELAKYIEGKNRYEIRLDAEEFKVEVTLSDLLASMVLGGREKAIGKDEITVKKSGPETIVKVVVTSQNGLETEEYTIAILEKSKDATLNTLRVNGVIINPQADGHYYATIKDSDKQIDIEAIATDTYAKTLINTKENVMTNDSYIAKLIEQVVDGKRVYEYTIVVTAEDGSSQEYNLTVEQLEANTNIIKVQVGEKQEELYDVEFKDGVYYYKINRVDSAFVNVELESEKSKVTINGNSSNPAQVKLPDEKNTFTITVTGEDGTSKDYTLIIEKKSADTDVLSIEGDGVLSTEIGADRANVYVDEDLENIDLTITLRGEYAQLKLVDSEEYEVNHMTTTVDFSSYDTDGVVIITLSIKAEDGTEKEYIINVYKQADLGLLSVAVNEITLEYDEEKGRYEAVVSNGNTPKIEIKAKNTKQKVDLLDYEKVSVLVTGYGTITTTQTLSTELITKYTIRITSHNGEDYGVQEYELWIRQKSTETGITYVKVDSSGATFNEEAMTYSAKVAGKDSYPVEIKLKDENAQVEIKDSEGNTLIAKQTGTLKGELEVPDGETKEFTIVVTSENGEVKEYTLTIERISSSVELSEITVTDYDTDGSSLITRKVTIYDEETKTYRIMVNKSLNQTDINVTAISEFTNVALDTIYGGKGKANMTKSLNGFGVNKVTIELTAADGTKETRYLEIIQLSDEVGIKIVKVDGQEVKPDESGNYETTVTNEVDLSEVYVKLTDDTSTVSINAQAEDTEESTIQVSKGDKRVLTIPIVVRAENGNSHTYILKIHIKSHDTTVKEVKVDGEVIKYVEGKYTAYIGRNEQEANVEIIAGVPYSTVKHMMEDGSEVSDVEKLSFKVNTSDLDTETFTTTFTIIAEDEEEHEYTIELIRKSDDNTIGGVFVNETKLEPLKDNETYDDNTYYIAVTGDTASVRVVANNAFATVEFNSKSALNSLEQTIALKERITKVPVTITSQEGTEYKTTIYIEKLSSDNRIHSVEVNYEEAELLQDEENAYISYIYDSIQESTVIITAEDEKATIVRTDESGEPYSDENSEEVKAKGQLEMIVPTTEDSTLIYFKIISEGGEASEVYTLHIDKMSTDTSLLAVYVDEKQILPDSEGNYTANVLDTNIKPKVKAIATNNNAKVRIGLGNEQLHIAEQVVELKESKVTVIPITVKSQAGTSDVVNLYINKISTSVALSTVKVNDKEANYYTEETHTYRFLVDADQTEFELFVLAESDYTTLEFNGTEHEATFTEILSMDTDTEGMTVTVTAKSESGLVQEYTIEIARKSNNVELEYIKVDGIIRDPDEPEGDTYTVPIKSTATSAVIEVKTKYSYAMVKISDNNTVRQQDTKTIDCSDLDQQNIRVPIVVTASDGTTVKTYYVVLVRMHTLIQGKVITENVDEIHKATVRLYLTSDNRKIGDETNPRQVIQEVETNEDGTFKIEVEDSIEYDLVISKPGYLTYTITKIELVPEQQADVGTINLKAGDVISDGEIELDDLVNLNANLNTTINDENAEEKGIYDFNEDGTIDMTDRKILQKNYGKKNEVEQWVNPKAISEISLVGAHCMCPTGTFALPLTSKYRISSKYGERINPVTGEEKLHAGIDLVGEHHGDILSIADGVVTYAGVQNGYGNCIEIKHIVNGETIYSFYAHLSEIKVKVGEKVNKGEVIGLEGGAETDPNHGTSTGHHLHFEIRTASGSGHSVDPTKYIQF